MSKMLKIECCYECPSFTAGTNNGYCSKLKDIIALDSIFTCVHKDCPLKDTDTWKKELLEWIEKEIKTINEGLQPSALSCGWKLQGQIIAFNKIKQKIEEMYEN